MHLHSGGPPRSEVDADHPQPFPADEEFQTRAVAGSQAGFLFKMPPFFPQEIGIRVLILIFN